MRLKRTAVVTTAAAMTLFGGVAPAWGAAPANDDFDSATVVNEPLPFTDVISTVEATTALDDPSCADDTHTVWYTYEPSADGFVNANTFDSDFDTTLSVYTGERGALEQLACNDDANESLQSSVTWEVVAGTTYFLMVGSCCGNDGGALSLTIQGSAPPPTLDVSVDAIARFAGHTGVATVSGTVTCTAMDFLEFSGTLRQPVGRFTIVGEFFAELDSSNCDGTPHPWSAEVTGSGKFSGGRAMVTVEAFGCGPTGCAFDTAEAMVRLRR